METRQGQPFIELGGRLVEVERFIEHDADMDSWERLEAGMPVLARMHDELRAIRRGGAPEDPVFANFIPAAQLVDRTKRGTTRIRRWTNVTAQEIRAANIADELARLVEAESDSYRSVDLRNQLVHGDFWDNNVFFAGDRLVFVTDFDCMGSRPRIDDLALTLYLACLEFLEMPVSDDELSRLRKLVDAYDAETRLKLSPTERSALPLAIARQPLWSIGGWVAWLDDDDAAREHARASSFEVEWGLGVAEDLDRWRSALLT